MRIVSTFLIALLIFPVFIFCFKISSLNLPPLSEWGSVLLITIIQAGLSAGCSVFIGIIGALGLLKNSVNEYHQKLSQKKQYIPLLELFCLLPALLPVLIPVMAWINVAEYFFHVPFSVMTVIIIHILINIGLVSVFFSRVFSVQVGNLSAWAYVHSVSRLMLLKKIIFYECRRDIALIFFLVFSFCFTSFSVPLLVGGMSGQTLEVLIAEKLKNPVEWSEAVSLFGVEVLFLFIFFFILYSQSRQVDYLSQKTGYVLPLRSAVILPLLPSILLCLGLLDVVFSKIAWNDFLIIWPIVFPSWGQTLLLGVGTGFTVLILLYWVAFCSRSLFLRKFLMAYACSSVAFMGFAFLLIGRDDSLGVLCKWILGLSLLFLPALYRLLGETIIRRLKNQIALADLMGASLKMSFLKVIAPQCTPIFFFLAGVAAFWACGDFAYSSIVSFSDHQHLAMLIQDVFASYRFELATILIWILIFSGVICFSLFSVAAVIFHKRIYLSKKLL